jgi:hypothetical protein
MEIKREDWDELIEIREKQNHELLALYDLILTLAQSVKTQQESIHLLKQRQDQLACIMRMHKHGEYGEMPWEYKEPVSAPMPDEDVPVKVNTNKGEFCVNDPNHFCQTKSCDGCVLKEKKK